MWWRTVLVLVAGLSAFGVTRAFGAGIVRSGSMAPRLVPGDVIVYERRPARVAGGDLVVFPRRGWPGGVVHRAVRVTFDGAVVTRGDANRACDLVPARLDALIGRVVADVPLGKGARALAALGHRCYTRLHIGHRL
jgi:signal peptidase I